MAVERVKKLQWKNKLLSDSKYEIASGEWTRQPIKSSSLSDFEYLFASSLKALGVTDTP